MSCGGSMLFWWSGYSQIVLCCLHAKIVRKNSVDRQCVYIVQCWTTTNRDWSISTNHHDTLVFDDKSMTLLIVVSFCLWLYGPRWVICLYRYCIEITTAPAPHLNRGENPLSNHFHWMVDGKYESIQLFITNKM